MSQLNIEREFEKYMRKVNPGVYEQSVQYKESRRVFFAGVAALHFHLTGPEFLHMREMECVDELSRIEKQLMEFKNRVVEGEA